ncbi:hypothetical protein J6590_097724 [Homalodisca vitripennis]|nr:hypothetical protein J6590_097724 [Homalodisca vitripennis]
MEGINTELLIVEVKKREAIWNSSSETYKDRVLKKNQWSQLCSIFCSNFEAQTPKKTLQHSCQTTEPSALQKYEASLFLYTYAALAPRRIWQLVFPAKTFSQNGGALETPTFVLSVLRKQNPERLSLLPMLNVMPIQETIKFRTDVLNTLHGYAQSLQPPIPYMSQFVSSSPTPVQTHPFPAFANHNHPYPHQMPAHNYQQPINYQQPNNYEQPNNWRSWVQKRPEQHRVVFA